MKIEDIPTYVVPMEVHRECDIDDCRNSAKYYYRNSAADADAFQVWNLCFKHSENLDQRLEANETT